MIENFNLLLPFEEFNLSFYNGTRALSERRTLFFAMIGSSIYMCHLNQMVAIQNSLKRKMERNLFSPFFFRFCRCVLAFLQEGVSVCLSECPSVRPFVNQQFRKTAVVMYQSDSDASHCPPRLDRFSPNFFFLF